MSTRDPDAGRGNGDHWQVKAGNSVRLMQLDPYIHHYNQTPLLLVASRLMRIGTGAVISSITSQRSEVLTHD